MLDDKTSSFLDMARWLSAWAVFLGHLRNELIVPYVDFEVHNIFTSMFAFVSVFGRPAVMVFFVLSGYLVGGPLLRNFRSIQIDKEEFIKYLINRLTRLYIVLIPALFIMIFMAFMIWVLSGYSDERIFSKQYSLHTMCINLLFLQGIKGVTYGGDYPLWSLTNEFSYYMIFPAMLHLISASKIKSAFISLLFILTTCAVLYPSNVILYGLIWLTGSAAFYLKKAFPVSFSFIIFVIAASVSRLYFSSGFFPVDMIVALAFSLLLVSIQNSSSQYQWLERLRKFHAGLANFSYTLYVLHIPFMMFCIFLLKQFFGWAGPSQPGDWNSWVVYIMILFLVVSSCYFVAYFTERNTKYVRKIIFRKIGLIC